MSHRAAIVAALLLWLCFGATAWIVLRARSQLSPEQRPRAWPDVGSQSTEHANPDSCRQALDPVIKNAAVTWDGDIVGLVARFPTAAAILDQYSEQANLILLEWLDDPDRFAAAHVALCYVNRVQCTGSSLSLRGTGGPESWNGLHVQVLAGGPANIDLRDQDTVKRKWYKWEQEHKGTRR
jgi:hypothetical protein